mmetsp:Transcript_3751/g.7651  ORF Transcript_3751/g.7651 Transcript_3751/m.7651 type:complete len:87 (-) Transcript_3751:389-649(-)
MYTRVTCIKHTYMLMVKMMKDAAAAFKTHVGTTNLLEQPCIPSTPKATLHDHLTLSHRTFDKCITQTMISFNPRYFVVRWDVCWWL